MRQARTVEPSARQGQVGGTWGNLLLPDGALSVGDVVSFKGEGPERLFRVTRRLPWPTDPKLRLYTYEAVRDRP